jgi:hypothetical protein
MIPRLDATLLDIIVESNSTNGKRIESLRASWIRQFLKQSESGTESTHNVGF